jgi:hypothetical protein
LSITSFRRAAVDVDQLSTVLTLFDQARSKVPSAVIESVIGDPTITQTIDGASTLEISVDDTSRRLVHDDDFGASMWAVFGGLHFELVSIAKTGDTLDLKFEDSIVAALRRRKGKLSVKAGTMTRREFVIKLAKEAHVTTRSTPRSGPGAAGAGPLGGRPAGQLLGRPRRGRRRRPLAPFLRRRAAGRGL